MARWLWLSLMLLVPYEASGEETDPELRSGAVNESRACASCHEDIYAMWSRSMHRASFTDPIFQASYMQAYLETSGEARGICLPCHAPVATLTGDLDLEQGISREGITCDYCHSVVSVDLERAAPRFNLKLDGVKRGPLADAISPAHEVEASPLHKSSELCAGCHEWTNPEGVAVLSTYTEWKGSPQAKEGKTCQHCHMPLQPGKTVRADLDVGRKSINLHNISGMHSNAQVQKAARARIVKVRRKDPETAVVKVEVENIGSGHSIPTGLPTRKLILEVFLYNGGELVKRFERVYQKVLLDESGRVIVADHDAMMKSVKILEDTRLLPGEKREEKFVSPVPRSGTLRAEMQLRYQYSPMLLSPQVISIQMASERSP